jgi:hypothetical protein
VPDMTNPVLLVNDTQEVFSAQLSNTKATFAAQLFWTGTAWNAHFVENFRSGAASIDDTGTCTHVWLTGDQARMDVFYNQSSGTITFTAYDGSASVCTNTVSAWSSAALGGGSFGEAYTGGIFAPAVTGPPILLVGDPYVDATATWTRPTGALFTDTKLFAVTGVHFTSHNGTMGTVVGPWNYQQLIFGSSSPNVFVSSPVLWNGGQNFGVWVRV